MPSDNVKNRTFKETLSGTVRFQIPFFQRGYAWEKKQWDQLFIDLQEQIFAELESGSQIEEVEHFFGPIVVMEQTGHERLKEFLVIDGQQRITTIYLLLALVRDQIRARKHLSPDAQGYVDELQKYLVNDVTEKDDYLKLKVFSSKGDRLPCYRVVFSTTTNPRSPLLQTDLQLYVPGSNQVDEFKKYAEKKLKGSYRDVPALWQLAQVLLNCLKIVWIPLDQQKDDAQAIFESLNDKGMPLTAGELLCNYLFRPIRNANEAEDLHNNLWLAAAQALVSDDSFEDYLRTLFSIGESKTVGKHRKVYIHFKSKHRNLTAAMSKQHLAEISAGVPLYQNIIDPTSCPYDHDGINRLLIGIGNTRMSSSTPFVLSVLKAHASAALSDAEAQAILGETLVLLVRRKVAESPTTQYDKMFPSLLKSIIDEPNKVLALQEQFRKQSVWVSDQEFSQALEERETYRRNDLAFSRMLLVEIDKHLQKHGQFPDYSTVNTIEHVIPQTLDPAWTKYLGADARSEELDTIVHTIGNLCLLSGPANSAVGQDPFEAKKSAYSEVTALARQIKGHGGRWDIAAVRARSKQLASYALTIWAWS